MTVRHALSAALALLLAVLAAAPVEAQKRAEDTRPLTGLAPDAVPTFPSVQAFLDARGAVAGPALRDAATRTVPGGLVPLAAPHRQAHGPLQPRDGTPPIRLERAPNGTVRWLEGDLGADLRLGRVVGTAARVAAAERVLDAFAPALALDEPAAELRVVRTETDALGATHVRFEQAYRGVPVWNAEVLVHLDGDGAVYAVNGTYHPTPRGATVTPTLAAADARAAAVAEVEALGRWRPLSAATAAWLGVEDEAPRLVLYRDEAAGRVRLAYALTLHANLIESFEMVVDAASGEVLERLPLFCSLVHDDAPPLLTLEAPGAPSAGRASFLDAQGADLNGVARGFRVWRADDGTHLMLSDLDNLNAATSELPNNPAGGALTISAGNQDVDQNTQLQHVTSSNNAWSDRAAVSSSYNMPVTYAYFRDTFGRRAIDGNDQALISIVHVTSGGQSMGNAYWNGRIMAYGDGDADFLPLAGSLDVAGHEMSHGVIQHTADLVYKNQPGALNESFADVFGAMIDRDDFLLGEDVTRNAIALRSLQNPDDARVLAPQPAHMDQFRQLSESQDNGGVHVNSGIPNRAAFLVIDALGHAKTEQIYYRALSTYLTRESQFIDARLGLERAARDLYGDGSPEAEAVSAAFAAVGIGGAGGGGGGGGTDGGGDDLPPLAGGRSLVAFLTDTGAVGVLDLTDPQSLTAGLFDGAVARFSPSDASQLSAPRDGTSVWYVDAQGRLAFVDTQSGEVSTFDGVYVQEPGDLWTASVAPDESVVALVSAYLGDPRIYLYDGETFAAVELLPETTVEGVRDASIDFPDVVAWSPNEAVPLLTFDAYHEVAVGPFGATVGYWALHEIDFGAGRIYDVLPPQPSGVNVGNPAYGKTDPDLLAFDVVDGSGVYETYVADFSAGAVVPLGTSDLSLGASPVADAQRPSFSPDDQTVVVTTPANAALLFVERSTLQASSVTFAEPIYNPAWFVLGGTPQGNTAGEASAPLAASLGAASPNPLRTSATLTYALAAPGEARLEVFDALGRRVAVLVDGERAAGEHAAVWDASGLANGAYVVRLEAAGEVRTRVVTVAR